MGPVEKAEAGMRAARLDPGGCQLSVMPAPKTASAGVGECEPA